MSSPLITKTPLSSILYEAMLQVCYKSTPCKVGAIALGVLLTGVATYMYCSQINAFATYTTFACSGVITLITILLTLIDYNRDTCSPIRLP